MSLHQTSIPYKHNHYPHYYLCNYLPLSAGKDPLSHSLLKFKRGRQPDLNSWIDCSLEMLRTAPVSPDNSLTAPDNNIISSDNHPSADNNIVPPGSFIIRALHHEETTVPQYRPSSLDLLGTALAQQLKSHYHPRLLRKSFPTQEIKGLTREQRETGLQGLYIVDKTQMPASSTPDRSTPTIPPTPDASAYFLPGSPASTPPGNITSPSFLIIDDILTTGTTMKMIIGAILQIYPSAGMALFTLAKADYDTGFNRSSPLLGQNYQLGEDSSRTVAEDEIFYSPEQLKARILSDTF